MKKNLHFLRLLLLSAFFLLLQPSSLWATDVEFQPGVTWTGYSSQIIVSKNVCATMWGFPFPYSDNHQTLGIKKDAVGIYIQSSFLKNVSSITLRVAKTMDTYTSENQIHIKSYACGEAMSPIDNSNWDECMAVTNLSIDKVINSTKAETLASKGYDPLDFDEVTFTDFPQKPFTGYLCLYVNQTPTDSYWADSYLIIPEITVTFADPSAPSPCPNCFLVTF